MQVILDEEDQLTAPDGLLLALLVALPLPRDPLLDQLRWTDDAQAIWRVYRRQDHFGHELLLAVQAQMLGLLDAALLVDEVSERARWAAAIFGAQPAHLSIPVLLAGHLLSIARFLKSRLHVDRTLFVICERPWPFANRHSLMDGELSHRFWAIYVEERLLLLPRFDFHGCAKDGQDREVVEDVQLLPVAKDHALLLRRNQQSIVLDLVSQLLPPLITVGLASVLAEELDAPGGDGRTELHLSSLSRQRVLIGRQELRVVVDVLDLLGFVLVLHS